MKANTVLVAEDDEDIREALTDVLSVMGGYEVHAVTNGQEALTWLRSQSDRSNLVIILDVLMPIMDGREFLRARGQDPELVGIPTLLFTASSFDAVFLLAMPGVRGLLRKPIRTEELLTTVAQCFSETTSPVA